MSLLPDNYTTAPLLHPTTVVSSYVLFLPVFIISFAQFPVFAAGRLLCHPHTALTPTSPNTPPSPSRPIPTNAPHFSRSCGIKIRAGTQLRALAGIAAPCPHYGVLLNRPTDRPAERETPRVCLFLSIGIRCWFLNRRMESSAVFVCLCFYCRLPVQGLLEAHRFYTNFVRHHFFLTAHHQWASLIHNISFPNTITSCRLLVYSNWAPSKELLYKNVIFPIHNI